MARLTADDVLREYRRKQTQATPFDGVGAGRRLSGPSNGEGVTTGPAADVSAGMAWMEERLERLAVEAAPPSAAPIPRHGRRACECVAPASRGNQPFSARGSGSALKGLAELEAAAAENARQVRAEQQRVVALRHQLEASGVDLPPLRALAPAAAPSAAPVCVRPAARSGDNLEDALARRVAMLREQAPLAAVRLAELELEREELEQLLAAHPEAMAPAAACAPTTGREERQAARAQVLVAQLCRINAVLKESVVNRQGHGGGARQARRPRGVERGAMVRVSCGPTPIV